jgi:hypothetical protein
MPPTGVIALLPVASLADFIHHGTADAAKEIAIELEWALDRLGFAPDRRRLRRDNLLSLFKLLLWD